MRGILDDTVTKQSDSLEYTDKQKLREEICSEIITLFHEDAAWHNAMSAAMESHRREDPSITQ